RELLHPGSVVPGDDLLVAPLEHAVAQRVVKLGGVDDHVGGLCLLPLGCEELEGLLEAVVAHLVGGGKPSKFERPPLLVVENDSPLVARDLCWFLRHRSSWCWLTGDTLS